MASRESAWPAGSPCWVDLQPKDGPAVWDFYSQVLGWEVVDSGVEFGHYGMGTLEGVPVAAINNPPPGQPFPFPPTWITYLATDDIEATAKAITEAGGAIMLPPMQVAEQGSLAIAADPTGALVGLWQAGQMFGFGRVDQPGAVVWNQHVSAQPAVAREFYSTVFGFEYAPSDDPDGHTSVLGDRPGGLMAGIGSAGPQDPAEAPAYWLVYFQVVDADATVAKVLALGGGSVRPLADTPWGRMGVVADPQGAPFGILQNPAG